MGESCCQISATAFTGTFIWFVLGSFLENPVNIFSNFDLNTVCLKALFAYASNSWVSLRKFAHFSHYLSLTPLLTWCIILTYSRQKFSGLSWMVKRCYIQDYSENFRGNTMTRTVVSDFIRPSIESSLTRRGKKRTDQLSHVDMWWGQVALIGNR